MRSIKLDEKCAIILEKLDEVGMTRAGVLYAATKPTQYPALMRRLHNLKEARLVYNRKTVHYGVTEFGRDVLEMLRPDRKETPVAPTGLADYPENVRSPGAFSQAELT